MANVDIRIGYKDSAWFTANATLVLKQGQQVHLLQTGQYKIGDGVTQLSALNFLGGLSGTFVESVTGDGVDNTDPLNPVLFYPSPSDIGLGNVDNTSDLNKPISTATQTALDNKLNNSGSNADQDIDIGNFSLNAKHVKINGTAGAGHLSLKHQSANITANTSESSLGADSSGNPVWKNDGNSIEHIELQTNKSSSYTSSSTTTYANTKALVDGLATKENTLGFTPENVSNKSTSVATDQSSNTKYPSVKAVYDYVIGAYSSLIRQEFTYTSGAQTFTLTNSVNSVYAVFVNGQELNASQYTAVTTTLTILDTLVANDYVNIIYSIAPTGINPSYTKAESDAALALKKDTFGLWCFGGVLSPVDNTTYYFNSTITPTTTAASHQMSFGFDCVIKSAIVYFALNTTSGSTENNTVNFRNITTSTSSTITNTVKSNASATALTTQTVTGLNISIGASDNWCIEWVTPAYVTNPVGTAIRVQLFIEKTS